MHHIFAGILAITTALSADMYISARAPDTPIVYERLTGEVVKVFDGDTVSLKVGSETLRVHLAGIDAPETGQQFASKARHHLSEMVISHQVTFVVLHTDRRGESHGELFLNALSINKVLLTDGFVWAERDYDEQPTWQGLESIARSNNFGLWRYGDVMPPWEYRDLPLDS